MADERAGGEYPDRPAGEGIGTRAEPDAEGYLEVTVTFLEMQSPPPRPRPLPHRTEPLAILRAEKPTVSYYRYLYETVGGPWLWYERRRLSDPALARIVQHPDVEVNVLYVRGVPAGYAELDRRVAREVELAYFGLVPEFIGRGLGPHLLQWAVDRAWSHEPRRVWLHTCTLDHPKALGVYQRAGFRAYDRRTVRIPDPRLDGSWIGGGD